MNFLLDENFPKSARLILECAGHEVFDSRQLWVPGSSDTEVMQLALDRSAVILTPNRDFFDLLGRQYPDHHGVVVSADFSGRIFQLRDRTWMVYPAPDSSPLCA